MSKALPPDLAWALQRELILNQEASCLRAELGEKLKALVAEEPVPAAPSSA